MVQKPVARLLLSLACLAAAVPARAVFIRSEMDVIEAEPLFDSEYFVDLLAFSPPLEWEWDWDAALSTRPTAAYRINGASLDCCSLLLEQEASLRRRVADWLDFRYDLRQRGDKDLDDFHQWLAFEAGPWAGLSFGAFGEPTFAKQDADIGGLIRWRPVDVLMVYGSRNAVDWNFNSRGFGNESYQAKPTTYEAGIEAWTPVGLLRPRVEVDAPLRRADPTVARVYHYRRTSAQLRWDLPAGERRRGFSLRYRYELKQEGARFDPAAAGSSLAHARVAHDVRLAGLVPAGSRGSLEAGAEGLWRAAHSATPGAAEPTARFWRWEVHPYARYRLKTSEKLVWEAATFLSYGELRRTYGSAPSLYANPVEAKLGLGVDFLYSANGRVGLNTNFDLDDATRHAWDGGNVRAQLFF
ncbi:MAG: hypothetical protein HY553_21945 [Elusimicrobia bacterium]|nr:hypothetical protein [Elusimicrobiota bacterium]